MKKPLHTLAINYTKDGAHFLTDFANTIPESELFERFMFRWFKDTSLIWKGGFEKFIETQKTIREIWEGKLEGSEDRAVKIGLGLVEPREEHFPRQVLEPSWKFSSILLRPRDLNDLIWLVLLQQSQHLRICANKDCVTPYFVKVRSNQQFCSPECALPAQRRFKRQWWQEHGEEWRKRKQKQSRKKKED